MMRSNNRNRIATRVRLRIVGGVLLGVGAIFGAGCGGGGGGSTPSTPGPTPIVPTGSTVVVQLIDTAGQAVDGLVTLGSARRATTGGTVSFANATRGAQTVSAEVNGRTYSQSTLISIGTNTVQITIDPTLPPAGGGTPPDPPPF